MKEGLKARVVAQDNRWASVWGWWPPRLARLWRDRLSWWCSVTGQAWVRLSQILEDGAYCLPHFATGWSDSSSSSYDVMWTGSESTSLPCPFFVSPVTQLNRWILSCSCCSLSTSIRTSLDLCLDIEVKRARMSAFHWICYSGFHVSEAVLENIKQMVTVTWERHGDDPKLTRQRHIRGKKRQEDHYDFTVIL